MIYSCDILIDIEKKFDLFDIQINGFKVWWMSRYKIYELIDCEFKNLSNNDSISTSLKDKFSKLIYLKSLNLKINLYKKSDILCVCGDDMRKKQVDGKAFDILFDYIGEYDKNTSYSILNTLSGKGFYKKPYTKNCYNMANMAFRNYVHRKMWRSILKKEHVEYINNIFDKVEKYLHNKYSIDVNLKEEVCKQSAVIIKEFSRARKILKKVSPKVLYSDCAYSPTNLIFVYAAKNLSIPVVEYQHGLINERHLGYMYNKKIEKEDPIPDFLCVYGSHFEKVIRKVNPQSDLNIIQYGNLFLYEQIIERQNEVQKEKVYDYLITTQGKLYASYWVNFIKELLKEDKLCKILVKVHPNEMLEYKNYYKDIINESRIVFTNNMTVYDCFKISKKHLSCFSTCHYEALTYDLPTYVIKLPGWQHVEHLKEYNIKYFFTARELKEYLDKPKNENILFDKFKKEFFNIESDKLSYDILKEKVCYINKKMLNL